MPSTANAEIAGHIAEAPVDLLQLFVEPATGVRPWSNYLAMNVIGQVGAHRNTPFVPAHSSAQRLAYVGLPWALDLVSKPKGFERPLKQLPLLCTDSRHG